MSVDFLPYSSCLWDLNSMPPSGSVPLIPGAGDSNPYGRRFTNPYCSSLQDEQGPLSSRWFQFGICPPNFKFELGQAEPNRTAISPDRDLADVWFDPARFDPPLTSLFLLCEIISITATRVSMLVWFRYVCFVLIQFWFSGFYLRAVRCECGCWCGFNVLAGRAKMHHQKSNKNWKNQRTSQCRLVWFWLVLWMACSFWLKSKQKWKKNNYKIMGRIALAWGKTQKREKPTSKSRTNMGKKLEKQNKCRCVRECRFGGSFFVLWNGKRVAVAVAVAVVGLNIGVDHSCSVALFVPSTLLTFGRRMNLSSILHPTSYILQRFESTVEVSQFPVSVGIHFVFVTRVRICVSCSR